jgi:hypothetical protein
MHLTASPEGITNFYTYENAVTEELSRSVLDRWLTTT